MSKADQLQTAPAKAGDIESRADAESQTDAQAHRLAEAHRGFVREMDRHLGQAYGTGGAVVLAVAALSLGAGWWFGWLTQVLFWLALVTLILAALFVVRSRIYARRDRLRQRIDRYCEANDVSRPLLVDYFEQDETYPFFNAIFAPPPSALPAPTDDADADLDEDPEASQSQPPPPAP